MSTVIFLQKNFNRIYTSFNRNKKSVYYRKNKGAAFYIILGIFYLIQGSQGFLIDAGAGCKSLEGKTLCICIFKKHDFRFAAGAYQLAVGFYNTVIVAENSIGAGRAKAFYNRQFVFINYDSLDFFIIFCLGKERRAGRQQEDEEK